MEKVYCVKDSNGRFGAKLGIYSNSMTKRNSDWKWDYYSTEIPMTVIINGKEDVELKIQKLRELNLLAKYDLEWEVVELTQTQWMNIIEDCHQKYIAMGKDRMMVQHYISSIEIKDIEKGCIVAYRRAVRDIYRKYKTKEYIVEQLV